MAIIGLRNLVFVALEKDDETGVKYAKELRRLKGARLVNMSPNIAEGQLSGDDQVIESESSVTSLDVSIETANLSLEDEAFLKGHTYKNGVMLENKDDSAPEIAVGFMAPKGSSAGGGFRMIWLTSGSAKASDEEYATKEGDNIEFKTPTIPYTFKPRIFDGQYRIKADTNDEGGPTAEEFFTIDYLEKDHSVEVEG